MYFSGMGMEICSLCLDDLKPMMSVTGINQEGPSFTNDGISTLFRYTRKG